MPLEVRRLRSRHAQLPVGPGRGEKEETEAVVAAKTLRKRRLQQMTFFPVAETSTLLEAMAVRPATQARYRKSLRRLLDHLGLELLPAWPAERWDDVLADHFSEEYLEGRNPEYAGEMMSALLWAMPALGRPMRKTFPRGVQAWNGWRSQAPPRSRAPLPWAAACGIMLELLRAGCREAALAVAVSFDAYLRPSEALDLLGFQVIAPTPGLGGRYEFWTLLLRAEELQQRSKTGEFDDSVVLDSPDRQWLSPCLEALRRRRGDRESFFGLSYLTLSREFHAAAVRAGVATLRPTLYSLRHGGASDDRAANRRSLREVGKRGRWRGRLTVRRYEKHGRLGLQMRLLSSAVAQQLQRATREIARAFSVAFEVRGAVASRPRGSGWTWRDREMESRRPCEPEEKTSSRSTRCSVVSAPGRQKPGACSEDGSLAEKSKEFGLAAEGAERKRSGGLTFDSFSAPGKFRGRTGSRA